MDRYTYIVVGLCIAVLAAYFILGPTVLKPKPAPLMTPTSVPSAASTPAPSPQTAESPSALPAFGEATAQPVGSPLAAPATEVPTPAVAVPTAAFTEPPAAPTPEVQDITVTTDMFHAIFTNRGGALRSLTSLDYFTTAQAKKKARQAAQEGNVGHGDLEVLREIADGTCSLVMLDPAHDFQGRVYEHELLPEEPDGTRRVAFHSAFDNLEVRKTFSLTPGSRAIGLTLEVHNTGTEPLELKYMLRSAAGIAPEVLPCHGQDSPAHAAASARHTRAVIAAKAGELKLLSDVPPKGGGGGCLCIPIGSGSKQYKPYTDRPVVWAGVDSTYFAALLAPVGKEAEGALPAPITDFNVTCNLIAKPVQVPPGQSILDEYLFYVGPKSPEELKKFEGQRFSFLLEPKGFDPIGRIGTVLGWFLRIFHALIPNYGIAIILLTVLVRVVLHPLTRSSQKAMYRMQKLQPKMQEVRERFKNDKQRQNEELMKLYKEGGANPIGGCLPLLLQFPILFGLFYLLQRALELRQEPFVFWINDLSKPDAVFCLGFDLPVLGRAVSVLPILMIAAMVVQQKMTPKSPDPQQQQTQKIMALMPIMFGIFFYSMASGLVLYWLVSTALGVVEQWYIMKHLQESEAAGSPAKGGGIKLRRLGS